MKKKLTLSFLICLSLLCKQASAESLNLGFPVECTLGKDCLTVHYVDMDKSTKAQDPYCGKKTYDTHKGTDFGINNLRQLEQGVKVLASLDGKVLRTRDGEKDSHNKTKEGLNEIKKSQKECGNGIIIEHDHNVQTFYCHLKENSLLVKPGDRVKKGDPIAEIGLSGLTEFPHLHFAIIHKGKHIDPFTGTEKEQGCGTKTFNHWEDQLPYEPFTLYDQGFTASSPNFKKIHSSNYMQPEILPIDSPALVYWIGLYHAIENDEIDMKIYDPKGKIFVEKTVVIPAYKQRPSQYFLGKKTTRTKLMQGTYKATATFTRRLNGQIQAQKTYSKKITIQ